MKFSDLTTITQLVKNYSLGPSDLESSSLVTIPHCLRPQGWAV